MRVRAAIRDTRVGILGHYYGGMLDVYTDVTRLAGVFGSHFELLEMDLLKRYRDRVTAGEIAAKLSQFHREFRVSPECDAAELERAARTSCALDRLVAEKRLGALAYYYEGVARQRARGHRDFGHRRQHPSHRPPRARRRGVRGQERAWP